MSHKKYGIFLSYRTKDKAIAKKLFRRLESWRTPQKLVGKIGLSGKRISRDLGNVCFDRDEFASASNIESYILEKIKQSEHLVVLCSPHVNDAGSWVGREIRLFRKYRKGGKIHSIIGHGKPPDCFPKELLEDNSVPLAADMSGDGEKKAVIKLIAGILDVEFDTLWRRHQRRAKRRAIVSIGLVIITACGLFSLGRLQKIVSLESLIASLNPVSQQIHFEEFYKNTIQTQLNDAGDKVSKPNFQILSSDDLNKDGRLDFIVQNSTPGFCGSRGCRAEIYESSGAEYNRIGDIILTDSPRSLPTTDSDYNEIISERWQNQKGDPLIHKYTYDENRNEYVLKEYLYCGLTLFEYCNEPLTFRALTQDELGNYSFDSKVIWYYDAPPSMDQETSATKLSEFASIVGSNDHLGLYIAVDRLGKDNRVFEQYGFVKKEAVLLNR